NNSIEGFNNKWVFNNFSEDFNNLEIKSDYSEFNMFYSEKDRFTLTSYGNNTVHYKDGIVEPVATSKDNESMEMYEFKSNPASDDVNKIMVNSNHGIIRLARDQIKLK
ncbi:MAG: hypothetical protein AAF901_08180, partial [Bacteroidota bacterium]